MPPEPPSSWNPEDRLIVEATRVSLFEGRDARLRQLVASGPDWQRVVATSQHHGVFPRVARSLAALGPEAVPRLVLDGLLAQDKKCSWVSMSLTGELFRLLDLLADAGIPAIPFKGPVLAADLYGDVSQRLFSDLDLLLPQESIRPARTVLESEGFEVELALDADAEAEYLESDCELNLFHPGLGLRVELHWRILPDRFRFGFALDPERLPTRQVRIGERSLPTLELEDLLVALTLHASKHLWERLQWLADLARLIAHPDLDGEGLAERVEDSGLQRRLAVTLVLARDVLGVESPDFGRPWIDGDPEVLPLADAIRQRLFRPDDDDLSLFERDRWHLRLMENPADRRYFLRSTFKNRLRPTPRDREWLALPRGLHGLYFVLRPLRLVSQYGFGTLRQLAQGLLGR